MWVSALWLLGAIGGPIFFPTQSPFGCNKHTIGVVLLIVLGHNVMGPALGLFQVQPLLCIGLEDN